jgi:glutamine amidotransferase
MLKRIGANGVKTSSKDQILGAEKIILPGVGSFDSACAKLHSTGLIPVLSEAVQGNNVDILGICLGMHLLFKSSTEGDMEGLGFLPGTVEQFNTDDPSIKIPHMGWNTVAPTDSPLFAQLEEQPRFYFAHSYHVRCPEEIIIGKTHHGYTFPSAVSSGTIHGVQFHPEKSHAFGLQLLKNFAEGI